MSKYVRFLVAALLISTLLFTAVNCATNEKPLKTEGDFLGFITEIQPGGQNGLQGRILVESHASKIVTKYWVSVKDTTKLFWEIDEIYRSADFDSLEKQQWVKVWFDGPVMESFPMQVTAAQVVIIQPP